MTFSDLRAGQPGGFESLVNAWVEDGQPVAIVKRQLLESRTVRIRVRPDGTADPGSVTTLPLPSSTHGVARAGDGMLAVWSTGTALVASPIDRSGSLRFRDGKVIEAEVQHSSTPMVACNSVRCLAGGEVSAVLLDTDANVLARLPKIYFAVAAGQGFLVGRCDGPITSCTVDTLNGDGTVKSSLKPTPATFVHAIFDGSRYVVLGVIWWSGDLKLWSVDPATGTWSEPTTIATGQTVSARLAWNGTQYALGMKVAPPFSPFPSFPSGGPTWFATMRFDHSFAPIDATPRKHFISENLNAPNIIGVPAGFVLFEADATDGSQRTTLLRTDGTIAPPSPGTTRLFRGVASQRVRAAAASRNTVLGMWTENDGEHDRLRAARVTRGGERLDGEPLRLSELPAWSASAASDGDSFFVAWVEARSLSDQTPHLMGAIIDPAGRVQTTMLLDDSIPYPSVTRLSLVFANGAYHLSVAMPRELEAVSISPGGTVVFRDRFIVPYAGRYGRVAQFDGTQIISVWSDREGLWSLVKSVRGPAQAPKQLLPASSEFQYQDFTVEPESAGGYLLFYTDYDGGTSNDRVRGYIARLDAGGALLNGPKGQLLDTALFGYNVSLTRLGGTWYASWIDRTRIIIPFDSATLQRATPVALPSDYFNSRIAPGWRGEALLLYETAIPTDLGAVSRATSKIMPGGQAERGRAVRH